MNALSPRCLACNRFRLTSDGANYDTMCVCGAFADPNLHEQLHSGQVVIDGEPKLWRTVARFDDTGTLWLSNEDWIPEYPSSMWQAVGEPIDVLRGAQPRLKASIEARALDSDLTACEEQRDVYRDRAQQLAGRVTDLTTALRSLIARVRRTGGYASPEEQAALWEAERVLGNRRNCRLLRGDDELGLTCAQFVATN